MDTHLAKLEDVLSREIAGMSPAELSWHPAGKWCAAEVLEHLYLTYTGTIKGFERVAEAGRSLATIPTPTQRLRVLVVVGLGYLPTGLKSPPVAQPRGLPQAQVLSGILPAIGRMDQAIARCEKAMGANEKLLNHPLLGPLTARQWRKLHLVHGLHHLKQIQRLRSARSSSAQQ